MSSSRSVSGTGIRSSYPDPASLGQRNQERVLGKTEDLASPNPSASKTSSSVLGTRQEMKIQQASDNFLIRRPTKSTSRTSNASAVYPSLAIRQIRCKEFLNLGQRSTSDLRGLGVQALNSARVIPSLHFRCPINSRQPSCRRQLLQNHLLTDQAQLLLRLPVT